MEVKREGKSTRYKDPAMAQIRISRVSGNAALFGSDVRHQHYIQIEIDEAEYNRDLSHDWVFGHKRLIEVSLTPNQFADMLTSMNTSGVPCTLNYTRGYGKDDGQVFEMPEMESRTEVFRRESREQLEAVLADLIEAQKEVKTILSGEKAMNKGVQKELLGKIQAVTAVFTSSMPFMADQFRRHMDDLVTEAKATVEAYVDHKVRSLGIEALRKEAGVGLLESGSKKEGEL